MKLQRWFNTVPPEYRHLADAFEAEKSGECKGRIGDMDGNLSIIDYTLSDLVQAHQGEIRHENSRPYEQW
jgi:hypothetical protein